MNMFCADDYETTDTFVTNIVKKLSSDLCDALEKCYQVWHETFTGEKEWPEEWFTHWRKRSTRSVIRKRRANSHMFKELRKKKQGSGFGGYAHSGEFKGLDDQIRTNEL